MNFFDGPGGYRFMSEVVPRALKFLEDLVAEVKLNNELLKKNNDLLCRSLEDKESSKSNE